MKNKSVTYGLIVVVVLVWGTIIFRIVTGVASEEEFTISLTSKIPKEAPSLQGDSIELIAAYRDPFLGKTSLGSYSNQEVKVARRGRIPKAKIPLPPPPSIDWSFIAYLGTINNKLQKKEIGIFRVNGNETLVNANSKVGDVVVLKITRDFAVVKYQNVPKVLPKSY